MNTPTTSLRNRGIARSPALGAVLAGVALLALAGAAQAGAILDNGVVQLGVRDEGQLHVCCGEPSAATGATTVGIRFVATNHEASAPGCPCEGWGAGFDGETSGSANLGNGGVRGMALESFATTPGGGAVSVVTIGTLRVTHDFHPANDPNLFEVDITLENTGGATLGDLRYRRVLDWDIEPTQFRDYVTLGGGDPAPAALAYSSDNGFASADPFGPRSALRFTGPPDESYAADSGPADHGVLVDFAFGDLAPGASRAFRMYLGAAADEAGAMASVTAIGAELYSLGQPSTPDGPGLGQPNTFALAFTGVNGTPIAALPVTTLHFSGLAGTNGWHRSEGNVTLDCVVAGGACTTTHVRLDGGAWTTYTGPFPVAGEGTHTVDYWSASDLGTVESTRRTLLHIDATPPDVATSTSCTAPGDDGWCRGPVDASASGSDALSGLASLTCRVDGVAVSCFGASVPTEGHPGFIAHAVDEAGNTAEATETLAIDSVAPVVGLAADCTLAGNPGWCRASTFDYATTASDATSGIASVACTLDGASAPCDGTVTGEGAHALTAEARDAAGNTAAASLALAIDSVAPDVAVTADCSAPGDNGWCRGPMDLDAAAADATSGLASLSCTLDGAAGSCDQTVSADGAHAFAATAVDVAGNSAQASVAFNIDGLAPVAALAAPCDLPGDNGWCRSASIAYEDASTDGGSGVASVTCTLDGASVPCSGQVTGDGDHILTLTAQDDAGNQDTVSLDLHLDSVAPEARLDPDCDLTGDAGWCRSASIAYADASSDATSGLASVTCTLDGAAAPCNGTVAGEGPHTLLAEARDSAGNTAAASLALAIDSVAPTAVLDIACALEGHAPWCRASSFDYADASSDATSGIASVTCTLDSAAAPCDGTVATEGRHDLAAVARDAAGNEASFAVTRGIDSVAPAVGLADTCATPGQAPWCRAPSFGYAANASDGTSGLAALTCTVDGAGAACNGTVTGQGLHTLAAVAEDAAGNTARAVLHRGIDSVVPDVRLVLTCTLPGDGGWCRGAVQVEASATDATSGVASLACAVDGAPRECDRLEVTGEGTHTVTATARDVAGNEAEASAEVIVDTVAPTLQLLQPREDTIYVQGQAFRYDVVVVPVAEAPHAGTIVIGDLTVVLRAGDAGSGMRLAKLLIDGLERDLVPDPLVQDFYYLEWKAGDEAQGEHTFEAVAMDRAGNEAVAGLTVTTIPSSLTGLYATLGAMEVAGSAGGGEALAVSRASAA